MREDFKFKGTNLSFPLSKCVETIFKTTKANYSDMSLDLKGSFSYVPVFCDNFLRSRWVTSVFGIAKTECINQSEKGIGTPCSSRGLLSPPYFLLMSHVCDLFGRAWLRLFSLLFVAF